ncbi:MAG: hypothetical protein KAT77_03215 [Nanoarchaeota archaeon]|nr:hypothetical protein [Nanoarchaeota archaeon]
MDHTHEYNKLEQPLDEIIEILEWFEKNEESLNAECGAVLHDITNELKEIKHVEKLLKSVD